MQEYCKRGHKRVPENLFNGGQCKECQRVRRQETMKPKAIRKYCVNGHERTPDNVYSKNGSCKICQKERNQTERYKKNKAVWHKEYVKRPEVAKKIKEIRTSDKYKVAHKESNRRYKQTIEAKEKRLVSSRLRNSRPEVKEKNAINNKKYRASDKGKRLIRKCYDKYYLSDRYIKHKIFKTDIDVPLVLIEAKRLQLKIRRLCL